MSVNNIRLQLLDFANIISIYTHKRSINEDSFVIAMDHSIRPFFKTFMEVFGYTNENFLDILLAYQSLLGHSSTQYRVTNEDFYKCVNDNVFSIQQEK